MDTSGGSESNSPVWLIIGIPMFNCLCYALFFSEGVLLISILLNFIDDNGDVDMNDTMDNLEERIATLEMVFAYLKNKKMLER